MMINKNRIVTSLLYSLCAVVIFIFTSCASEDDSFSVEKGKGYLVLDGIDISFQVDDVSTRTSISVPSVNELLIEVVNTVTDDKVVLVPGQTTCLLEAGSYKVIASYGENVCGATPYLYGESPFEILASQATAVDVTASLVSAVVYPAISDELLAHYTSYQLTLSDGASNYTLSNNEDFFVSANASYVLILSGTNQIGEQKEKRFNLNNLQAKTRYKVNAKLLSFSMPQQAEGNAWSKFIYITPMTASDMITPTDNDAEVINNVVYEASPDDGTNWITSIVENGRVVIKGLQPSTTYKLRSRFVNVVSSNTVSLTTESALAIPNGSLDECSITAGVDGDYWGGDDDCGAVYEFYSEKNPSNSWWRTNNQTKCPSYDAGYIFSWGSRSGTRPESNAVSGSCVRIMASGYGINIILQTPPRSPKSSAIGSLYTDKTPTNARPVALAFYYKYVPYQTDSPIALIRIYNGDELIGSAQLSSTSYDSQYSSSKTKLSINYTKLDVKATALQIVFESGKNTNVYKRSNSDKHDALPMFIGSELYIDEVELLYE